MNTLFSNKDGIDKKTLNPTYFIDIKSEGLRDILRMVLGAIRTVNLNEDKPTVWLSPLSFALNLPLTLSLGGTKPAVPLPR